MITQAQNAQLIKAGYTLIEKCTSFNPTQNRKMLAIRISNSFYPEAYLWFLSARSRNGAISHMCQRSNWLFIQKEIELPAEQTKLQKAIDALPPIGMVPVKFNCELILN